VLPPKLHDIEEPRSDNSGITPEDADALLRRRRDAMARVFGRP